MGTLLELGLFAAGVFAFSIVEYAHHRNGGHLGWFGKSLLTSHRHHHRDPLEGGVTYASKLRQRAPLVALILSAIGGPLWLVATATIATPVLAGMLAGYVYSEWFHHAIHHRAPRNRFERFMWRYHYVHHFKDVSKNIGFTSPLWDFVSGSMSLDRTIVVPAGAVSRHAAGVPGVQVRKRTGPRTPIGIAADHLEASSK